MRSKTFEYISAPELAINIKWETTFRYALSRPSMDGHLLVLLDLFGSESYDRAKGAVRELLGADKRKLRPALFRKMAEVSSVLNRRRRAGGGPI